MFQSSSAEEISRILRSFHLPMFAAERHRRGQPFVIVCSNDAHQKATGLSASQVEGKALGSFLPAAEARRVAARYEACAKGRRDLRYVQRQMIQGRTLLWDTSLQFIPLDNGGDRIIGTALEVLQASPYPLFDDIRYFSSLAELQLQNLTTLLDAAQKQGLFREHSADRVARLSALCRGVQRAVDDIRNTVHRADGARAHRPDDLAREPGGCTLDALNSVASEKAPCSPE